MSRIQMQRLMVICAMVACGVAWVGWSAWCRHKKQAEYDRMRTIAYFWDSSARRDSIDQVAKDLDYLDQLYGDRLWDVSDFSRSTAFSMVIERYFIEHRYKEAFDWYRKGLEKDASTDDLPPVNRRKPSESPSGYDGPEKNWEYAGDRAYGAYLANLAGETQWLRDRLDIASDGDERAFLEAAIAMSGQNYPAVVAVTLPTSQPADRATHRVWVIWLRMLRMEAWRSQGNEEKAASELFREARSWKAFMEATPLAVTIHFAMEVSEMVKAQGQYKEALTLAETTLQSMLDAHNPSYAGDIKRMRERIGRLQAKVHPGQ